MATIPAFKSFSINSINAIVAAGRNFGFENISCNDIYELIEDSVQNDFTIESYTEIFQNATDELLKDLFYYIFRDEEFIKQYAKKTDSTVQQVIQELTNIVIEKNLYIQIPSLDVSLEQLNTLAEKKLISLYHIERVKSIDVEFVQKYHEKLDIRTLLNVTKNKDVRNKVLEILS